MRRVSGALRTPTSRGRPTRVILGGDAVGGGAGADEIGEVGDTGEGGARLLAACDFDAEFLFERDDEFEGVDRVEIEAGANERIVVADVFGLKVVELQRADDELFQLSAERIGHGGVR